MKAVFLTMNTEKNERNNQFLVQNVEKNMNVMSDEVLDSDVVDSLDEQDLIDSIILDSESDESYEQCLSEGNIYSEEELSE